MRFDLPRRLGTYRVRVARAWSLLWRIGLLSGVLLLQVCVIIVMISGLGPALVTMAVLVLGGGMMLVTELATWGRR
jgi:hypothetical protein